LFDTIAPETAGDPMSAKKWIRSSLRHLHARLKQLGHTASRPTLRRLLHDAKFTLKANAKRDVGKQHPHRNAQFVHIADQRTRFREAGLPIISIDTKKKELIGNFKNHGRTWCQEAEQVLIHDFAEDDTIRAVPYGIYDLTYNRGFVSVGTSADTPEFAVDVIATWWETHGQATYPGAKQLLILADSGGSNGCHPRAWKLFVQKRLSDRFGLEVTICHYPAGCSKWNPIEYRLFSPISINWAGQPLRSLEIMLGCLKATTTCKGLRVEAIVVDRKYLIGQTATDPEMAALHLQRHEVCPRWNYTFQPRMAEA
jgi:hypothetical protein